MKIVGLTGGIGSGKTTISEMFKELGIPVYIADDEARKLTNTSETLKKEIIQILGERAYVKGNINKKYVASLIFNDKSLLKKINKVIHPKVTEHFKKWCDNQKAPYLIKEAAILFENDGYKSCDLTILVTAPLEVRIDRVLKRDSITEKEILDRIKNQWNDDKKGKLADFIIENISLKETFKQVKTFHLNLLKHR